MYDFILRNNTAIHATYLIIYTINKQEVKSPALDEAQKNRIIASIRNIPHTIAELDPPPDELTEALKGKKFTSGKELNKFITDWRLGASQESRIAELENKINEQQRIIDEMINYEAVN